MALGETDAGIPARRIGESKGGWDSRFEGMLRRCVGAERGGRLAPLFLASVGADYRARVGPAAAVRDCLGIDALSVEVPEVVYLRNSRAGESHHRLQWFSRLERPLDECLPWLEHLGLRVLDQIQFVAHFGDATVYLRSFSVESRWGGIGSLLRVRVDLIEALQALLEGRAESDSLNGLVLSSGLSWREVDVLRAYRNYAGQLDGPRRRRRAEHALIDNPGMARLLFRYFEARFDPALGSRDVRQREESLLEPLRLELSNALNAVAEVSDDRALRDLFNLIDATLRTNFYLYQGQRDFALTLKIDSLGVIDMATPRPVYEIYVHAVDIEGIHLRGAKVARGGIRWSDRHDDLRSEILDLQQTQMIKNSLIVPQGAKGGFLLKEPPSDSEARTLGARRGYRRFIGALLDVTDMAPGDTARAPTSVLAYDGLDPYLVVAADKGTAGFSDTANEVAEQYGFWLGDAFASGGSRGYSHKRFGITARGAWECIRRHFREMDRDVDRESISVVGIGSMDGDVFGNGMLLSRNIRLLGAFSSHHIFLDPAPDPEQSFRERQRLFDLASSTWDCYDRALISPGGGVFPRAAKRIALSPAIRSWLGVHYDAVDGEGLVLLLLAAPVDLLWFGGIGTFVKGAKELNEQLADHGNDAVRVDATELRAKVIGEGANLGLTQQARVEYALLGGRINMDALDNSAGVDLSDHEVNLKILLRQFSTDGLIAGRAERDALLGELADEVSTAVLAHNGAQSLCVSLDQARCRREPEEFLMLAERLASSGLFDGERTVVPDRVEILARPGQSLTRPELTVLLARAKLALKSALSADRAAIDPAGFEDLYRGYFPPRLRRSFEPYLSGHPLAYEITVSQIGNTVIDRAGASFLMWMDEPTPALIGRAVSLYRLFDRMLQGTALWSGIVESAERSHREALALLLGLEDALATLCRWGLGDARRVQLDEGTILRWSSDWTRYVDCIERLRSQPASEPLEERQPDRDDRFTARFLIEWLSGIGRVEQFPYIADLKRKAACSMEEACWRYLRVASWFGWPAIGGSSTPQLTTYRYRRTHRAIAARLLDSFLRLSLGSVHASFQDPRQFLENLSKRGQLMRIAGLRRELAATPVSGALEILVLLMTDAEAAADCTNSLEDL